MGTNGSPDYRCLLIKELNSFVFLAPILGSLEAPRAGSWPEERYEGQGCFSSGHQSGEVWPLLSCPLLLPTQVTAAAQPDRVAGEEWVVGMARLTLFTQGQQDS